MKIIKKLNIIEKIILLLFVTVSSAQAQGLTLNVSVTDETCPGTGALALSVQNADPGSTVNYKVYLYPETNVPIWNSSNGNVIALQDGDYKVVASQVVNGTTVSDTEDVTINSLYVPLSFNVSSVNAVCGNDGSMVVEVTAGTPATYEILDGPQTAGPQTSNVFPNLPPGDYEVRVTDECGNGFVSTQTFYVEQPILVPIGPAFSGGALPSCNTITVNYTINTQQPSMQIVYPLSIQYTVHPPSGNPVVYNQTVTEGGNNSVTVSQNVAFYDQPYTIDFKVTDICGTVYQVQNQQIVQTMSTTGAPHEILCGDNILDISVSGHMPPFTINFTTVPSGFNPADYNSNYPGPFQGSVATFGDNANAVPLGMYKFTVTDACGKTATGEIEITEPVIPEPAATATNHDCVNELGSTVIAISNHPLDTATIVSAPAGYAQIIPYNCSNLIEDGVLTVEGMPQGDYIFTLTDVCGNTYQNVAVAVPEYSLLEPQHSVRPDCIEGYGTIRMTADITSVTITDAPDNFDHALPYDVSFNIVNGTFAMEGLIAGDYKFTVSTVCESGFIKEVNIPAFSIQNNEIDSTGDCSNFDVDINYQSSAESLVTFWLQLYNDELDTWVHPETGAPYAEGAILSEENALQLQNEASNDDLSYVGKLRVMKMQRSFCNGTEGRSTKNCIDEFYEFEFYNELNITGIYNLTCVGEIADVQVNVQGVSPLHFEIISKNGSTSFYVDNGENNIFTGLEAALYMVRVTDPCGGYRVEQFNVAELPPLVSATTPPDLANCDEDMDGQGTFDLTTQNELILGDLDPEIVTITYHSTQQDAEQDMNALPTTITSGTKDIFARVEWNVNRQCYGLATFKLIVMPPTPLQMQDKWAYCNGQAVTVVADPGYVAYEWSTGETTQSIEVGETGSVTVTATSIAGCVVTKTVQVVPAEAPSITGIDAQDWTDDQNSVTVHMANTENPEIYEYSIDGINWQDSNHFDNLMAGEYTVTVRDKFGCNETDEAKVRLLTYPKYFTPNGDGENDKWRIPFAFQEPDMQITVFDRYGKPITSFGAMSEGWDGTMNGSQMPSTDYWFVVKRQDGRECRGHFAMMR